MLVGGLRDIFIFSCNQQIIKQFPVHTPGRPSITVAAEVCRWVDSPSDTFIYQDELTLGAKVASIMNIEITRIISQPCEEETT